MKTSPMADYGDEATARFLCVASGVFHVMARNPRSMEIHNTHLYEKTLSIVSEVTCRTLIDEVTCFLPVARGIS